MASNLNISGGNKPQKSYTNGVSGYTRKPYLGRPRPLQLAPGVDGSLDPELSCQYCRDTGHLKENCVKLNRRLAWKIDSLTGYQRNWKAKTSLVTDLPKGEIESGPHPDNEEKALIFQLKNASILAETKIKIMQWAVAKCPKVCISAHGIQIPSLLDSSSEVTLLWQSYFDQDILPKIKLATG